MRSTSRTIAASAAALSTIAFFMMTAPAAYAADYCITNGAQEAHGCGYPTMEACQAASAGIGGYCAPSLSSQTATNSAGNRNALAKVRGGRRSSSTLDQPGPRGN